MYDRARKIRDLVVDAQSFLALAEEQQQAYAIAANSLTLVDQANAWFVLPIPNKSNPEVNGPWSCLFPFNRPFQICRRRRITRHIPEAKYGSGKYEAEVIQLADIQYDYAALSAHIDLVRTNPTTLSSEGSGSPCVLVFNVTDN